ncbi:tRNA pseudouridine(55) synthase TruB [Blattabacterium cuenoti]|uniref:tRNA pseudouridine(55) synthase TruB n=1 Tax=Blattabacterium cuenoti TaxID=1653831 RepID=UPI00163BAA3B|nr:tRNA pseudouridine(55) synthase TruB [Blattabacterium cuenoti]
MNFNLLELQNGMILMVDKPWGWSSFKVVKTIKNFIKRKINIKIKIGHSGTLDPMATGLLIILIGKATKKTNIFHNYKKSYTGIIKLGCETISLDSETEEINFSSISHITPKLIEKTSKKLIGEINQIPPYFSALKKNGKRLYQYARNKEKIELFSRKIIIYKFNILNIWIPYLKFFIECGKGTYIRSVAKDLGYFLNSKAYLFSLRRESIGNFFFSNKLKKIDELSNIFSCYTT